jgi:hypothetical protein
MCTPYNGDLRELLIPSGIYFDELCISHDKTLLFIIAFTRTILYWTIFNIALDNIKNQYANRLLSSIMWVTTLVNLITVLISMTKKPKYKIEDTQKS